VETGADVPIPGCPTGAGLAIMLAGIPNDRVPDATVLDRIVGYERLAACPKEAHAYPRRTPPL